MFAYQNSGLSFIDNGSSPLRWRFAVGFQIIPLLVLLAVCWVFPESPRWLVKVGREDEGRYVLRRLRGDSTPEEKARVDAEFQDIKNIADLEKKKAKSISYFSMLFGVGAGQLHTARRVQLVVWLQIMQEWVGIAGVTICKESIMLWLVDGLQVIDAPTIFRLAGFDSFKSQWFSGLNNILYMVRLRSYLQSCPKIACRRYYSFRPSYASLLWIVSAAV